MHDDQRLYAGCGSAESYLMGHLGKEQDEGTPRGEDKNRRTWVRIGEE